MRLLKLSIFLLIAACSFGQTSDKPIKYSGSQVVIRKNKDNSVLYYSEKHDKILFEKDDFELYPDTEYHTIHPVINIFYAKEFTDDKDLQLCIRIAFNYTKQENGKSITKEIINYNHKKTYYPSSLNRVTRTDENSTFKGRIIYHLKNKSQIMIDNDENGKKTIFYIENSEYSYLNFALMMADCVKAE